jgi:hypothetical protein
LRQRRLRLKHEVVDDPGDPRGIRVEARKGFGIARCDLGDTLHRACGICIKKHMLAVGEWHEDLWLSKLVAQAVPFELEIIDHALPQHSQELRGG